MYVQISCNFTGTLIVTNISCVQCIQGSTNLTYLHHQADSNKESACILVVGGDRGKE